MNRRNGYFKYLNKALPVEIQITFQVSSNHSEHVLPKRESHLIPQNTFCLNMRQTEPQAKLDEPIQL